MTVLPVWAIGVGVLNSAKAWLEIVRALCVVALVFLNFGLAPAPLAAGIALDSAGFSLCGDEAGHDHAAPCHACRPTLATLPPPPAMAGPARLSAGVCHGRALALEISGFLWQRAEARGPPRLA